MISKTPPESTVHYSPEESRPTLPAADKPESATAILQAVLVSTLAVHDELAALVNLHSVEAPSSSSYLRELDALLARTVLDWIGRWPS